MHTQIVHDDNALTPLALFFELDDEWYECVCVVSGGEGVGVEKSSFGADCADHGDGLASLIGQLHSHALLQPNVPRRLPQIEGGLVYVNDFNIRAMHDKSKNLLRKLLLLRA